MAGIQSISQLYDIYGEDRGKVLASGFGTLFGFHTNDDTSREFISSLMGKNVVLFEYTNRLTNNTVVEEREGRTVEEWTQINLGVGQAVVALADHPPFLYQFDEYT
jgi:type IV secretory pathway TraG/TraD family ATPase VirD4